MLVPTLILSIVLFLIANGVARYGRYPTGMVIGSCLAFGIVPGLVLRAVMLVLLLQMVLFCIAAVVRQKFQRGPAYFLRLSCGATLIAYAMMGLIVWAQESKYARLRIRYPYESMEARVPSPRRGVGESPLPPSAFLRLAESEDRFPENGGGLRGHQLFLLHERAVALFINSPGFGYIRMPRPSERGLASSSRREPAPLQPGPRFTSAWSPGEWERPSPEDEAHLADILRGDIWDFADPRDAGFLKDRRHVAGFLPHRIRDVSESKRWNVQSLELVSLLLHDEPVVYVSDRIPQMDRTRNVPTRPLDRFEWSGLARLRDGEDLFLSQGAEGLRMLGAVRSLKQCVACHGGERGELLGAFSYQLRSEHPDRLAESSKVDRDISR